MKGYRFLYVLVAIPLPSCLIYDESMFGDEDANAGVGGTAQGDGAGTGGDGLGSGGVGGTLPTTGGSGPSTGGETSAGGTPSTGGGAGVCDPEAGDMSMPITPLPTTTKVIEDFNLSGSAVLAGGNSAGITGSWYQPATTTTPNNVSWLYERDPCLAAPNKQMRVQGTPEETYGVSFDATLDLNALTIDASAFDGVMYWARTNTAMPQTLRIAFRDDDASSVETSQVVVGQAWTQRKVSWPGGIDPSKLKLVQIVAYGSGPYDLWVDDLVFYED